MRDMERPAWAPGSVDIERPSPARIYDYFLGGTHNVAVDRDAARELLATMPDIPLLAQINRAFLRRVVRFLVDAGIRQFLDLGSGIPTVRNVHEEAQAAAPETRVVYVDIDPVAVAHSREILAANDRTAAVLGDINDPVGVLAAPEVRRLLDFDQPIGIVLVSVLHFVPDEHAPWRIVKTMRDAMTSGSYAALSHGTSDGRPTEFSTMAKTYDRIQIGMRARSRAEVLSLFEGFQLVEPGLVWIPQWRPDSPTDVGEHPERSSVYGGVGRKA